MPPFSTDDYYKLLQKIAVLETKILRLEVNVEVNGQYGNETTLQMTQISGKEQANRQMLCAKPKHNSCKDKSPPSDMGRRLTGRTQHLETRDDTEWPALPSHRRVSSTPVPRRKQPWNVAKTKRKSKPTKDTGILLENRFAPLLQDPVSPKERSSSSTGERYEAKSYTKRLQKELTTGPQTLIVGDGAVNKTKHFFSKNTKVRCFTNDMVSDISEKILEITAEHPTVKSLVIHTGALDVVKQQSEVLKRDFNDLLNKVRCLNTEVFISGPLPTVRQGDERFSRLLMLNRWLKDTCAAEVNFIDNFNIFWERRHLFEADGFCLNKSGVQLLSYNIFDFLRRSPAAPAKDKRRDNPKQQIRQPSGEKLLPPEIRSDHEGQHTEREALTSSSLPQHEESPPAPTTQHEESPPAPTTQQEESPPAPTTQQEESPPAPTAQQVESPPAPPGDSQLSPTGTPSSLSFSPRSPDSPFPLFLDFQLTPRPNPIFSPLNPPPRPAPHHRAPHLL
ncbi:hypothetical protein N1851_022873 [Merluccius polli]|uniref:Uncharacterized protein n=1 Tax=Merluccius polli TaxID=89951 RepID=A0AA47M175_MERPO|nr:hypothetical protein N1851_033449 [Merluccius polli]KAK0140219.1 hypothetical protein N1851_022873 [Merluccius polli]